MNLHFLFSALIDSGFIISAYVQTHQIRPSLRVLHNPPKATSFVRPSSGRGAGIQMGVCRTGPQEGPLLQLQMALPTAPFPAGARAGWQLGSGWRPQRQLCSSKTRVFCNVFQWDKVS